MSIARSPSFEASGSPVENQILAPSSEMPRKSETAALAGDAAASKATSAPAVAIKLLVYGPPGTCIRGDSTRPSRATQPGTVARLPAVVGEGLVRLRHAEDV